jgi:UPF0271 protein
MPAVDLNIDLGELAGEPEELYALATVANIACGGHAGDEASMRRAVRWARAHGTRVAAHPSYADRDHFGRVRIDLPAAELYRAIVDQVSALGAVARAEGVAIAGVKAHGALYHACAADRVTAAAFLDGAISAWPAALVVVGPPDGILAEESRARGLAYAREGFADRRYAAPGKLVPRSEPNALIEAASDCAAQAARLAREGEVDTICVHGDGPKALATARAVRAELERALLLARKP